MGSESIFDKVVVLERYRKLTERGSKWYANRDTPVARNSLVGAFLSRTQACCLSASATWIYAASTTGCNQVIKEIPMIS